MDTLFTLVIAVGGIATGMGAIWTAMVTRHLARATLRSVAQSEQSLAEQSQHLREQNERARINLEVDLMYRLGGRFNSPRYQNYRKRSLEYVQEHYLVDDILEVRHMDAATEVLFDFLQRVSVNMTYLA